MMDVQQNYHFPNLSVNEVNWFFKLGIYNLNFIIYGKDQRKENMLIYTQADNLPGRYSNEVLPIYRLPVLEENDKVGHNESHTLWAFQ
jgi:hypothetical protein